ncbi:serine protease family protein [Flavobacterium sedimenticola]|uniref:Trypsin-like peptidase domain-containing protein n=1 Tax=Flavobacterium sedimenticola TaxID=3043286 RepID=A0ABT6XS31_9FLAO|nr:trypsin-like peptidase domain-containing protein [Flavobacterium sedimenticola]MDI9257904.1 trypsin-like peptidase domain-containing protein [Flavobacterium sedimenticola]
MKDMQKIFVVTICSFFILFGCSKDSSRLPSTGITETDLIAIEDALEDPNTNFVSLINKIRGSVGTNGSGSKVVWSKRNNYNLGLFVSANHVYGVSTWPSFNEEFFDLFSINNGVFGGSIMPPTNGAISLTNERVASFALYHPSIPSDATNFTVLPKDDFYLGIMDNQRIIDDGMFGIYPDFVQTDSPLQMFDPNNRTLADQTWSVPNIGDVVIAIGYPNDRVTYPNGAVSSGKIYSDSEAENIIQLLNQDMDPEGDIPYNPQVEFLANIKAVSGMSGGGVFNENGQLLGIMVRATALNGQPILRVVRMSYIVQKLTVFFDSLPPSEKAKIEPFISGELN